MGSERYVLNIADSGEVSITLLHAEKEGIIRNPAVSYNGEKIAFSMRRSELQDDYHLYVMDRKTHQIEPITSDAGIANIDPGWLPCGDLILASSRCDQSVPCWSSDVTNLYWCDAQGRYLRRLTYDQAHNLYPQPMPDGRILYTRWEYSDRVSGKVHKLFVMNSDGTAQTEYYGNNSHAPRSIIHAKAIPGSSKVMVIGAGHHPDQSGKLMRMDRSLGTQENEGLEYVAPVRYFEPVRDDLFGKEGELFQYPLPIDEENYLVSYLPEGGPACLFYPIPFGIYWMNSAGDRELLIYDPTISSGQIVPRMSRQAPLQKVDGYDFHQNKGYFYVQNIYHGPGLQGIPRGTVKKMRVIALSIRVMSAGVDYKSAYFKAPSRVAFYFQLLDEKGGMVQSMRS